MPGWDLRRDRPQRRSQRASSRLHPETPQRQRRRPQVLDLPRPAPPGPHDLHRGRARGGLHCPHVRHQATLRATPSAQIQLSRTANPRSTRCNPREPAIVSQLRGREPRAGRRAGCLLVGSMMRASTSWKKTSEDHPGRRQPSYATSFTGSPLPVPEGRSGRRAVRRSLSISGEG
jgi:hypothetical protein